MPLRFTVLHYHGRVGLAAFLGRNQDAGHAISSGSPVQPGDTQRPRQSFCGDNRCDVCAGTPVDYRPPAWDDRLKAETNWGKKDNGASCSNRLLRDCEMNLRGKNNLAKQSTPFRNCCRVRTASPTTGALSGSSPRWLPGSDIARRKWIRFSPASTKTHCCSVFAQISCHFFRPNEPQTLIQLSEEHTKPCRRFQRFRSTC
jgi:hypothetical protein